MADKTLSAHFSVTENVTDKLEEIQDELEETAAKATGTATALEGVDAAANDLDDSTTDLNNSTDGLAEGVEEAKQLFGETSEEMDSVKNSMDDAKESLDDVSHATNDVNSNIDDFEINDVADSMQSLDESAQRFTETAGESEGGFDNLKESVDSTKYSVSQTTEELGGARDELSNTAGVSDEAAESMSDASKSLDGMNNDLSRAKSQMHDFERGAEGLMEAGDGVGESVEYVGRTTGDDLVDPIQEAQESVQELDNTFDDSETNAFDFQRRLAGVGDVGDGVREKVSGLEDDMEEFAGRDFEGISGPLTERDPIEDVEDTGDGRRFSFAEGFDGEVFEAMDDFDAKPTESVSDNLQEASNSAEKLKSEMQDLDQAGADAMFGDIKQQIQEASDAADNVTERKQSPFQMRDVGDAMERLDQLKEMKAVNTELGQVSRTTARGVSEEGTEMANAIRDAKGLEEAKDATRNANVQLARSASRTAGQIAEESETFLDAKAGAKSAGQTLDNLAGEETELARMAKAANNVLDDQQMESFETAAAAMTAAEATDEFDQELKKISASAQVAQGRIDEVGDEMRGAGRDGLAASLNLGPFNFALSSIAVQLPAIITLLGGLSASLLGVATAALIAAGAMGAIFAGGVMALQEQGMSLQDMMKQFKEDLKGAMEPLVNEQSLNMLRRFLDGIVRAVSGFAQAIASMQDVFSGFQAAIGGAFFDNFPALLANIELLIRDLLPFVEDFFVWFFEKLPKALNFFRKQGNRIMPVIADVSNNIVNFLSAFSEFGVTILKGILPAIGAFLSVLTDIIQVVNALPEGIASNIIKVAAFVFILKEAVDWGSELADKLLSMVDSTAELGSNFAQLAKEIAGAGTNMEELNDAFQNFQENRVASQVLTSEEASQLSPEQRQAVVNEAMDNGRQGGTLGKVASAGNTLTTARFLSGTAGGPTLSTVGRSAAGRVAGSGGVTGRAAGAVASRAGGSAAANAAGGSTGILGTLAGLLPTLSSVTTALSSLGTTLAGMSGTIALLASYTNPVTAAIATIVIALGALLALFTSLDVIMQAITGTIAWAGNVIMAILGPAFNLLLELLDLILAPVYAVADGIKAVLATFSPLIGILQFFGAVIMGIAKAIGWVIDMAAGVIDFFAGIVYTLVRLPFDLIAWALNAVFKIIGALIDAVVNLQAVQEAIAFVINLIDWFVKVMERGWYRLVQGFEDLINSFIGIINEGISLLNSLIPGVNPLGKIGKVDFQSGESGADVITGGDAEDGMEEEEKTVTQNYIENHQYDLSGSEFNMKPEEKARVKGLIQEAIREANQERRMQDGGV